MKKLTTIVIAVITLLSISFITHAGPKRGGIVNVIASKQGVLIKNFSPFAPKALHPTKGCFYETLVFANNYSGTVTPWLAKKFFWSDDLKTLTLELNRDVKWNDGKPFTADDVVFTVRLGKDNKALDKAGIWKQGLLSIDKINDYKVSFIFDRVNTTILPQVAGIYIIPKHIWQAVDNPSTWTGNENPVGTGPFMFEEDSFTEQSYRLKRNPNYWQKGLDGKPLPYINGIQYVSFTGNSQATMKIISGDIDWGTIFIANIDKVYVNRNPKDNHYWIPEGNIVYLNLNNAKAPFSNVNVRRAVAMAINQKEVTTIMNSGAQPAHQSGVKQGYISWLSENAKKYALRFNPKAAVKLLEKEGYSKNADGIMEKK